MKTTREWQFGVLWGNDLEPVIQWGIRSLQAVREAADLTQKKLAATTEVTLPFKIVKREIIFTEGEWVDA